MTAAEDEHWMALALAEARKGIGRTAPNPPVGAVIVKNGQLLGSGSHRAAGQPHAEREALAAALQTHSPKKIRGSTIYITLEPCSTQGRTPPCTTALIQAGISKVIYACTDENPAHAGRADEILRSAGLEVLSGVRASEAGKILRPFFKVRHTGLPWVIWKTAMSLDGRITRPPGEGQWITGKAARADVQILRSQADAILTSGETVRRDLPALTIRQPELLHGRDQPWRVILTENPSSLPQQAPLFTDEWKHRTLIRSGGNLSATLRDLVTHQGILTVMIEAGGKLSAALIEAGLIDEAAIYLAPLLCGGPDFALAEHGFPNGIKMNDISFAKLGPDIKLTGLIQRDSSLPLSRP